jgi:hypothetical protein
VYLNTAGKASFMLMCILAGKIVVLGPYHGNIFISANSDSLPGGSYQTAEKK